MRLRHKTTGETVDAYVCLDADYPLILTSDYKYRITTIAEDDWEVQLATKGEVSELLEVGFEKLTAGNPVSPLAQLPCLSMMSPSITLSRGTSLH